LTGAQPQTLLQELAAPPDLLASKVREEKRKEKKRGGKKGKKKGREIG